MEHHPKRPSGQPAGTLPDRDLEQAPAPSPDQSPGRPFAPGQACEDVLGLIGNTPLVRLRTLLLSSSVKILAKIEAGNPGGSIKDRVALAMIRAAEASGELTPDKIVVEATSGNTGIGLAMVCAVKGYRLLLIMPETASEERKRIMRAYGARLVLTPGRLGTDGAIEEAYRLARQEPETYVLMDQFNNPASIAAHAEGTAIEVWEQTAGQVTHVVSALGTSGTAMGLARRLHRLGRVRVVGIPGAWTGRQKVAHWYNEAVKLPGSVFEYGLYHLTGRLVGDFPRLDRFLERIKLIVLCD